MSRCASAKRFSAFSAAAVALGVGEVVRHLIRYQMDLAISPTMKNGFDLCHDKKRRPNGDEPHPHCTGT